MQYGRLLSCVPTQLREDKQNKAYLLELHLASEPEGCDGLALTLLASFQMPTSVFLWPENHARLKHWTNSLISAPLPVSISVIYLHSFEKAISDSPEVMPTIRVADSLFRFTVDKTCLKELVRARRSARWYGVSSHVAIARNFVSSATPLGRRIFNSAVRPPTSVR